MFGNVRSEMETDKYILSDMCIWGTDVKIRRKRRRELRAEPSERLLFQSRGRKIKNWGT